MCVPAWVFRLKTETLQTSPLANEACGLMTVGGLPGQPCMPLANGMVTSIHGDLREGMDGKMEDEGWMIKEEASSGDTWAW